MWVVSSLIRSAVINWRPGKFFKKILTIQSHERNVKPFRAASSIRQQQQTPATAGKKTAWTPTPPTSGTPTKAVSPSVAEMTETMETPVAEGTSTVEETSAVAGMQATAGTPTIAGKRKQ
jgi:hypothetical protein